MVKLMSQDGEVFCIRHEAVEMLPTVKAALEETREEEEDTTILVENVQNDILKRVIDFCEYHTSLKEEKKMTDENTMKWEAEYFNSLDHTALFQLILAASFLNCHNLLDLSCKIVADQIRNKSPDEIRMHFNIQNDFTPEEEDVFKLENLLCKE